MMVLSFCNLNRLRAAQLIHSSVLQLIAQLDRRLPGTACQDCDILQHFFSSVTITRSLYADYVEGTTQLVNDQGGQSLALNIFSDDQKLCAALYNLLQQRQDLLNICRSSYP